MSEGREPGGFQAASGREAPGWSQQALLQLAHRAALAAGALLADRFALGTERATATKSSPTDLVSQADIDAERLIREAIERERPDDGLVGEEGSRREGTSGLDWVVDPLDGTVNFLLGIPQWCVSVAVRDRQGPLAGVIYDPLRGETFSATRAGTAELQTAGSRSGTAELQTPGSRAGTAQLQSEGSVRTLSAIERAELASAMIATGLAYGAEVREAQAQVLARLIPRVRDIRRFGSAALDLAWTAAGRYDAFFERSLQRWDVEAGLLICERAGLRVVELPADGVLPWGVLAATPRLAEPLLAIVG